MKTFKSQKELFMHVWNSRTHVSELTGKPLLPKSNFQHHWQFLHILAKGTYPAYKFREENIMLALPDEHERQEQFPKFIERRDELRREYYKEIYNKTFEE